MKAFKTCLKPSIFPQNTLIKFQAKHLHKSFRPTFYNLRHYYSNLRRNDHGFGKWEMIYGPDGFEKVLDIYLIFRLKLIEIQITTNLNQI